MQWMLIALLAAGLYNPDDLRTHKVVITRWTTGEFPIPNSLEASRRLFVGELAKHGILNVKEVKDACEDVECGIRVATREGARYAILVSINELMDRKYFVDLRVVDVENDEPVFITQYTMQSFAEWDRMIKVLATSVATGVQAEQILREGWKRKPKMAFSFRGGYNYFVGTNSYRRYTRTGQSFAEPQPQRAFNMDIVFSYFMGSQLFFDLDFRVEMIYRGLQIMFPFNYIILKNQGTWVFLQAGPLFGFGPTREGLEGDWWQSSRDGMGFVAGTGLILFPTYNFNVLGGLRYTHLFNNIGDRGYQIYFGLMWSPVLMQ